MRAVIRRLLPTRVRRAIAQQREIVGSKGVADAARWNAILADAWTRDRLTRRVRYRVLTLDEVRSRRRSDTVFVFGTGSSLNAITPEEWAAISEHDVFGFNAFYHQRWVRTDFHLLRGGLYGELRWRPHAEQVSAEIAANPNYANAVFVMQDDFLGSFPNQLVGYGLLPRGASIFRYRTAREPGLPTRSFAEGVRHAPGTLSDAVNCAYLFGWKRIALAGIDLYDNRHFYLGENETTAYDPASATVVGAEHDPHGMRYDEQHNTARSGIVGQMGAWREALAADSVDLVVYNPRSLLAEVLPVFEAKAAV